MNVEKNKNKNDFLMRKEKRKIKKCGLNLLY